MAKILISVVFMVCFAAVAVSGESGMPGGWFDADPNADDVQEIAKFAASTINKKSNSPYHKKLVQVIEAHTQVVAGMNYRLKMEIHLTVCKKADTPYEDVDKCDIDKNAASEIYDATVFDQPWTGTREITEFQRQG